MNHIQQMLEAHPRPSRGGEAVLVDCIQACLDCAQTCASCADACLGEQEHLQHLVRCIRLNLDCADVCNTTGRLLSRQTESEVAVLRVQIQACAEACRACGAECQHHAESMGMEHCRLCAESCRRCEEACNRLLGATP